MKNDSVNPSPIAGDSAASVRVTTRSTPSPAPKAAHSTSLGHRLQRALTGGPNRRSPGLHSPLGAAAAPSIFLNRRLAFPILALMAALAFSLLFLIPGGPLQAEEAAIEYAEDRMNAVETYTAEDPEGATISWSLSGTDADAFKIVGGVLTFAKQPDYESPVDVEGTSPSTAAAGDNMYEVTVQATDETMKVGMKEVTVEVTNVDEPGEVTLSALGPQVATELTATPSDPDGDLSDPKWQWSKSMSRNGSYADIEDANASTYTPKTDDTSYYLMAQVTYEDPEGADKTAMEKTANTVQSVRSPNNAPEFPDQDAETPGDQSATGDKESGGEHACWSDRG